MHGIGQRGLNADDSTHRRYLIAVGITTGLSKSGQRIVDSVNQMTELFTEVFHYKPVTLLGIDPATDQIRKSIREFCLKCDPGDVVALYYTGHADEVNQTHRVWTGDTIDPVSGTLETSHLAELMLVGTPLRYALIILDTCFAGEGGAEALRAAMPSIGESDGKTLALLTAADPREQIVAGDFARLFSRAVGQPAVAGHEPPYLALGAIARLIDADQSRPGWQTVSHSLLGARTDLLPYFPNPRFNLQLRDLDLLTQLRIEQKELRLEDLRRHFLPRARGVDVPTEPGWRFVGRQAVLRDLVSWLSHPDDRAARVVTGGPGSGKSAVIGRLVVLSDPEQRPSVPMKDLAADTIPPVGSIADAVHARGLTSAQVLTALCATARVRADTPADLLRQLRGREFTVAIDAIDEALDPPGLVATVLRPLVEAGPAEGLRLLLGTRPHLLGSLGVTDSDPQTLNLDEHYADPDSVYEYVLGGLETDHPESPYYSAPAELVAEIGRAVAAAAGHSFLVALIVSRTLLSRPELPDPADPGWRDSLPGTAAAAMHSDLETRLGTEADRARDLLLPLAFAQGAGLPWEDLWAPLASRLSGRDYTEQDLIWLRRQAGSYVVEAMESGLSAYLLYHAALAEYLRQDRDEGRIHGLFTAFLEDRVPTSRQGPDWSRAHPYILAHLATHAQRAGRLDPLLLDPGYLVNAVPAGLLAALPAAQDADAELAGRAYQRVVHQLRDRPEEQRFSYLELGARISRAAELARRIAARAPRRPWSVPWTHWPPEHPHRILDGHLGPLNGVVCVDPGDGSQVAVSIGQDAMLRMWDVATAEPRGAYPVGDAPLIAIGTARLPGHRTLIALLSADGMLHRWDMSTADLLQTKPVASRWRRLVWLRNANLTLRCAAAPDGHPFALVGGRGLPTSVWDLASGCRVAVFPPGTNPGAIEFSELIDEKVVIAASTGGTVRWMRDLQTGRDLPDQRQGMRFSLLRALYHDLVRGSNVSYYALSGGPPVVAVRFSRRNATIWDLTASYPRGTWPRGKSPAEVRLTDGRTVLVPVPRRKVSRSGPETPGTPGTVVPFGFPVRRPPGQSSPRFRATGRFLRVQLGEIPLTLAGHTADVTGYDWTRLPDGQVTVVTSSRDGTVRRWDNTSIEPGPGEQAEQARGAHRIVTAPLDDGTPLGLTIDDDDALALWDLRTGELAGRLEDRWVPSGTVGIACSPGYRPVAVTFDAGLTLCVWDLPDGTVAARFPADRMRWPGDAACTHLPDGTRVAVTSGHGRRTVVWDLATGRIRHVLTGHRGWSACVTCVEGPRPLALTGGADNRVNVWDLRHGRRRRRLRIVPPWTFLARPSAGRAHAIRVLPLEGGQFMALVATTDGMVRALLPRGFPRGARRAGAMPADVVGTAVLGAKRAVVITATGDGVIRIWPQEAFTRPPGERGPLCEINIELPVSDIGVVDRDTLVFATPNGLTAIRLDARLLEKRRSPEELRPGC